MELACASLHSSCPFPVGKLYTVNSRACYATYLSFTGDSVRYSCPLSKIKKGCSMLVNPVRPRFSLAASVGETTAVPNELPLSDSSDCTAVHNEPTRDGEKRDEKDGSVEGLDDRKMMKLCDKLIEVFIVDKPTPTDWRRLLAFSEEWSNI